MRKRSIMDEIANCCQSEMLKMYLGAALVILLAGYIVWQFRLSESWLIPALLIYFGIYFWRPWWDDGLGGED